MKTTYARNILIVIVVLVSFVEATAQTGPATAIGTPPFGSFGGGPLDVINLGNLNVDFAIPIRHKAGRGMPFTYDLVYDSSIWVPVGSSGSQVWTPVTTTGTVGTYWGWQGLSNSGTSYISYSVTTTFHTQCGNNQYYDLYTYGGFVYYDRAGAHPFGGGGAYFNGNCPAGQGPQTGFQPPNPQNPVTSWDGSGLTLHYTPSFSGSISVSAYITTKSGVTIVPPVVSNPSGQQGTYVPPVDTNGNTITLANGVYTDTLGQTAITVLGTQPSNTTFSYAAPSGGTATYTVSYKPYTVKTNYGCSGVVEYPATAANLVDKLTLPDGTFYQFGYEATAGFAGDVTGRLASVTLPTGGSITYSYPLTSGGKNGINCTDGSAPAISGSPSLTRIISPGGTWKYTRAFIADATNNHWQTTVNSPVGDDTVIDFQRSTPNFYETQRQTYQGLHSGGTLLLTKGTCYNNILTSCTSTVVTPPIAQADVTLQYPNGGLQAKTETKYNSTYNLVNEVYQSAYGVGAPGSWIRHTATIYASLGNIFDHPASVTVDDQASPTPHTLSKTTYAYDEYLVQGTTGTPNHTTVTSNRGNLTTVHSYSTATASLTRHFHYYDTGTLYQSADVNGATTSYTYDTTAQSCGNSFPTKVTSPVTTTAPLGLSVTTVWNCTGGVATSTTDANSNTVSTTYTDSLYWRPASVQDQLLNTTNFIYTAAGTSNPASVESKMLFNSNSSISEQLTTFDTLGRPLYSQQQQDVGSANYDSTQVIYDTLGRPYKTSMPYVGAAGAGGTAAVTTKSYDALGRVTQVQDGGTTPGYMSFSYGQNDVLQTNGPAPAGENLKQKQLEYDALGRLVSVCEITAGSASAPVAPAGACGQTTPLPPSPGKGYLTTYAYDTTTINSVLYTRVTVTQNAQPGSSGQQTRIYVYDLLGRLIQETNPETGQSSPGNTFYSYDSDTTDCSSTSSGDLVKKVDNRGNKTCYNYDVLHRVLSITYGSTSPDFSLTPAKTFVYDAATYGSTAMTYAMGRLAEAYTGPSATKTTDEFFSYSKRGELLDTYQFSTHSGTTYYHVTAGFWANGAVASLSSNITGLPSQTYGVDGKGRSKTVTAGSGQNPVTGTTYDLVNYKTTVTYGSLDSDVFTMDQKTGRLASYKFNVGTTQSDTGTLTWNPNGSLATLAINDTVTGTTDTQTCNYTHDDLARIASVNCGNSTWRQNFTYDAFGNINKDSTGFTGLTFIPGYSQPNNQYSSLPGVTVPYYDTDGRVTWDGGNHYTWDADSRMNSVNTSTTLTYDAFGRMVEKNSSGTYTQIVYSPLGSKIAVMSGATLQKGFVPLPTGSTAVYTSSGLAYYRHTDHLGSSRMATTPTRTMYSSTAYAPFGEAYKQAGTTDLSFTGQDQDTISGMHDFLDRRYIPNQGRWLTPDPIGLAAVDPTNPQSWNRYAYVQNNPLALIDPFGDQCYDLQGHAIGCGAAPDGSTIGPDGTVIPPVKVVVDVTDIPPDPVPPSNACDVAGGCPTQIPQPQPPGTPAPSTTGETGGPGNPATANNATQAQIRKECIDQFNDSGFGKFVNFMSMASPLIGPDRRGSAIEDVGGTAIKYGVYKLLSTVSKTWVPTPFGSLSGVVADAIHTVAKDVVAPIAVDATGIQIIAHAGCDTVARQATGQMTPLPPGIISGNP